METITNISKTIEEHDSESIHKLTIQTTKEGKKWMAFIGIHIPNESVYPLMPEFFCQILLNDKELDKRELKNLIGRRIIGKEQLQIDEHTKETSFGCKSHMTKLSFKLSDHSIIHMRIGEVYHTCIDNYYEHSGEDTFL